MTFRLRINTIFSNPQMRFQNKEGSGFNSPGGTGVTLAIMVPNIVGTFSETSVDPSQSMESITQPERPSIPSLRTRSINACCLGIISRCLLNIHGVDVSVSSAHSTRAHRPLKH